jgi:hypothetical protein
MTNDEKPTPGVPNQGAAIAMGIGVGVAIGVAIGVALDNIGVGIAIGAGVGVALGIAFSQSAKGRGPRGDDTDPGDAEGPGS